MTEHKAAVALRVAAADFAAPHPVLDAHDRAGQRRNRKLLKAAVRYSMTKKRGYSREFTPKSERRCTFTVDRVPPTLYDAVKAKAKRQGLSDRALVLSLLKRWLDES